MRNPNLSSPAQLTIHCVTISVSFGCTSRSLSNASVKEYSSSNFCSVPLEIVWRNWVYKIKILSHAFLIDLTHTRSLSRSQPTSTWGSLKTPSRILKGTEIVTQWENKNVYIKCFCSSNSIYRKVLVSVRVLICVSFSLELYNLMLLNKRQWIYGTFPLRNSWVGCIAFQYRI